MTSRSGALFSLFFRSAVGLAALAAAIAIFGWLASTRETPVPRPADEARPRMVVIEARPTEVQRIFAGFGTAEALYSADVPAEVAALVESIHESVREGMPVQAGDVLAVLDSENFAREAEIAAETLAELDSRSAQLDVEEAAARDRMVLALRDLELAKADLARTEQAVRDGAAVEREVERAQQAVLAAERSALLIREVIDGLEPRRLSLRALLERARASKRLAEQNLARCTITTPIDGVVAALDVEVGESVAPGRRVARVVDLSRMEIPIKLASAARRFVAAGDVVLIERDANDPQGWQARVARVSPVDEPGSRTFTVYAELEQDPRSALALVPGTFVLGTVLSGEPETRMVVPRRSVRDGRIMLAEPRDGGHAIASRPVEVSWTFERTLPEFGIADTQWVVLDTELAPGALVLLDGSRGVSAGTLVRPVLPGGGSAVVSAARPPEATP